MSVLDHPVVEALFDVQQYDGEWLPVGLGDAIAFLQEKLDAVPVEYRDTALIEIDATTSYDQPLARIEITYKRPPTAAEVEKRRMDMVGDAEREAVRLKALFDQQMARVERLKQQ